MWACILLHNYRTETMGRNQIRSYFEYLESMAAEDDVQTKDTNKEV